MLQFKPEASPAPSVASFNVESRSSPSRQYEVLLVATAPLSRCDQVRQIFSGVAAHRPNYVRERHMKFQPNKIAAPQAAADQGGGSQIIQDTAKLAAAARRRAQQSGRDGQAWLMEAVETIWESYDDHVAREKSQIPLGASLGWTWKWHGLPDPTMKTANARSVDSTQISGNDPIAYAETQDYRFKYQFALEGEQWVHQNVVIDMRRLYKWPEEAQDLESVAFSDPSLIDGSKQYLIEARVMLEDGSNNELVTRGINELTAFRDLMQGSIDFKPVDRLALDTRAR